MTPQGRASGPTSPLIALLAAVVDLTGPSVVIRTALEHLLSAFAADGAAVVADGVVVAHLGPAGSSVSARATATVMLVDSVGPCGLLRAPCRGVDGMVVVARARPVAFSAEEQGLLSAMAQVLSMAVQARSDVDVERSKREQVEARADDADDDLLAGLLERSGLLERLSRIQRSISSRQPLEQVLDSIVAGAADLLGEDIVGLRLLDPQDPGTMVLASSLGVPDHLAASTQRQPVGKGIGGRAIVENALVHTSDYVAVGRPVPGFAQDGILSAMAAPVRQGDRAVGSLVVATRRPDRHYSASEQEALTAFAEHVSLALNDAQSVAALHRAVADATHRSRHDDLTGLPNRAMFLDELARARGDDRGGPAPTVLFVDLDDFKLVNDSLGHLVGDGLLTAVGRRIVEGVRGPDVVARLGGDEFAVLMTGTGQDEAEQVAERVLESLAEPFIVGPHTLHVRASIGMVTGTRAWDRPEELLRDADVAMYRAKADGKHRVVVFAPAMRDELQARTLLEAELRHAVDRNELVLHHQPLLDARTGRVVGTEALLRWEHPVRGLVPPGAFIPLAEETGLIVAIGAVVLREACRQTAAWRQTPGLTDLSVSVNVSPRQLLEDGFVPLVQDVLESNGLPAGALVLELTESLLVDDAGIAAARLHELKALGLRLAVDDFGTGWSSLSYLARLPVDILKVDRSFVAGIGEGPAGKLAWAVLALADSLELETVAEGVETLKQAEALVEQGCNVLQGYLLSPPVPADQLPGVVAQLEAAYAARKDSRTVRSGLSMFRSTSTTDCQVPSASSPSSTGRQA